ncbi:putative mitochondrial import inner membrane translocase subunit tim10 protein [Phaeoacremonium minimum UCRPA7]|uniref:Mitochondrial import inner membrane translocase subunit n=1 Tax=Phaeoacremonium minimum (strain UCR-PA7) TaxID=1286976 RepID=R8BGU1_PHAM7|nr:putative mitochondrial import inner membrane translocase subunit tim10 protein [Phaeoacremonium minimum UCRPA7]EON98536.1 putative mitochondrial import inner membrane translocase subunit tim10 protein [Phaeoacremonium minimum UCRPA7]
MSFFGIGRPQPSSAEKIAAVETEMKFLADLHNRLNKACQAKCIPGDYREGELNKGESVCLDRCTAKFMDVQMKVSDILQGEQQKQAGGARGFGM